MLCETAEHALRNWRIFCEIGPCFSKQEISFLFAVEERTENKANMKQTDKRSTTNNQPKRSVRSQIRENKANQPPKIKNTESKPIPPNSISKPDTTMDSEESSQIPKTLDQQQITNSEKDRDESDTETVTDSVSTSGDDNSNKSRKVPFNGVKVHPKLTSTPSSVSSEGIDDNTCEEQKEVMDDETKEKIEEMETRIEKLEEELREVAALEISLYSVVPEHGSSAHKVHTPARRLSRLYIHAAKHYSQGNRATIAKNTSSGLVLIAKSCGNDVPRLTFWWSNAVVLREIITQAFGSSCQSSITSTTTSSSWKGSSGNKQINKPDFMDFIDDWEETRAFTSALEKVESWIFSRIVESIWWQTLTPNMQSLADDTNRNKSNGNLEGNFSINLWRIAFHDAFKRLCPVRAGGHECGCLPVLARMVMEQCVARLDVAMFNAILRESVHEIPTDPVSDPIVETRVLPIPAGDLSFGSGAQLKNAVGNWSRWLSDWFGMDSEDEHSEEDDRIKCFHLLNALSDLLMLPKDMLMDRSVRTEVCPSISLPLLKRILCNFTPDEFCPDSVPGAVLEAINAEAIIERRLSGDDSSGFPYAAAPVTYKPPSTTTISQKVSEANGKSQLNRNASVVQRKGYTSDEELEELDSPLSSIIDKLPSSPTVASNGNGQSQHMKQTPRVAVNARYQLLREVWSS
ncbi:hypothetical protein LXL04_000395 [Taraxacum kok-saghyz]